MLSSMLTLYVGASIVLGLFTAFWLGRFPIDRAQHEARLAALDNLARAEIDGGP